MQPFDYFKQVFLSVSLERTKSNPFDIELLWYFKAPELWLWSENSSWHKTQIKDSGEFKDEFSLVWRKLKPDLDQTTIYYRDKIKSYIKAFLLYNSFSFRTTSLSTFPFMILYVCGYICIYTYIYIYIFILISYLCIYVLSTLPPWRIPWTEEPIYIYKYTHTHTHTTLT